MRSRDIDRGSPRFHARKEIKACFWITLALQGSTSLRLGSCILVNSHFKWNIRQSVHIPLMKSLSRSLSCPFLKMGELNMHHGLLVLYAGCIRGSTLLNLWDFKTHVNEDGAGLRRHQTKVIYDRLLECINCIKRPFFFLLTCLHLSLSDLKHRIFWIEIVTLT